MYRYIRSVTTYSHQLSGFSTNWDFPRLSTNTYSSRFYENTLPNKKLNFSLMSLLTFVNTSINTNSCVYLIITLQTTEVDVSSARTSSNVFNKTTHNSIIFRIQTLYIVLQFCYLHFHWRERDPPQININLKPSSCGDFVSFLRFLFNQNHDNCLNQS